MEGRRRCITLRIVLAIFGIVSGISIFVTFLKFGNINAAIWGLLSAVFASVVLRLHISYVKRLLHRRFTVNSLRILKILGIILSVASLAAAITYFILMKHFDQGYKVEGDGYGPAGTFALLTLKWTLNMFCEGRKYEQFLQASGTEIPSVSTGLHS